MLDSTYLGDTNDLSVCAPPSLFEKLGYLSRFSRTCLTDDNRNWVGFDDVQQTITVFGYRQQRCWFVQRGDEAAIEAEVCHYGCYKAKLPCNAPYISAGPNLPDI